MGIFAAVVMAVVLSIFVCVAFLKMLSRFVKNGAVLFLLAAVLGPALAGIVLVAVVMLVPDNFTGVGGGGSIGVSVPVFIAAVMSYYLCMIVWGFFRFRKRKFRRIRRKMM